MKCAYCSQPIRVWQKKKPMGPGPLPLYGQYEHTDCHRKRAEFITKNLEALPESDRERQREINDEVEADLYIRGTR
jgi:hypothetical protein